MIESNLIRELNVKYAHSSNIGQIQGRGFKRY